jgi:hypothetical protein
MAAGYQGALISKVVRSQYPDGCWVPYVGDPRWLGLVATTGTEPAFLVQESNMAATKSILRILILELR